MKKLIFYIIISIIITIFYSCAGGFQVSSGPGYGMGYGINSGPYGYGSYTYPRVNVGVYGGGYPRVRY